MRYRADFHIHSCLSPCASLEMAPEAIARQARKAGLDAIALADHNCAFNLPAFASACAGEGLECLFGMEVTTREEVHMLCLFDDLGTAVELGGRIYDSLPSIPNQPDRFGDQPIVDGQGNILGFAEKFLISASGYGVGDLPAMVHERGGLLIPAHIDRAVFGIVSQLGFLPDEDFDAVELTARGDPALARHYPVVRSSDAHQLADMGKACTLLEMEQLSIRAVRESLWAR